MKPHDFYNLLETRIDMVILSYSGIYSYPPSFIEEYNAAVYDLRNLRLQVLTAIDKMSEMEKRQTKFITESRK